MKRKALRAAFPHTLPVLTGYAFLGLAYGILMQSAGFPFWYPALISLVVYAGSMQYAAVPLLGAAFDPAGAFFLTLMVNARHLFYGVSMLEPYRAAGKENAVSGICNVGRDVLRQCVRLPARRRGPRLVHVLGVPAGPILLGGGVRRWAGCWAACSLSVQRALSL